MLLGLWYVAPFFFKMNHLILLILEDLQVVFEELDREYLVSKVIQGG